MNRKQRRAKGVKNSDPTFVLKKSDLRVQMGSLLKNDAKVQDAIKEEVHRANLEELKKQSEDIDAIILINLHNVFGFGKSRLLRFAKGLADLRKYYEDRYEGCYIEVMKMHLKDHLGIDVEELEKEIDKYVEENTIEG